MSDDNTAPQPATKKQIGDWIKLLALTPKDFGVTKEELINQAYAMEDPQGYLLDLQKSSADQVDVGDASTDEAADSSPSSPPAEEPKPGRAKKADAPICPYCGKTCKATSSPGFLTRYECPIKDGGCGIYSVKLLRPTPQREADLKRMAAEIPDPQVNPRQN